MNCVDLVYKHVVNCPEKLALWDRSRGVVTYGEFGQMIKNQIVYLQSQGLNKGDRVFLVAEPSVRMYASFAGMLACGIEVVVIEPWISTEAIDEIVTSLEPSAVLRSTLGKVWTFKNRAVRKIERQLNLNDAHESGDRHLLAIDLMSCESEDVATMTFTSGTTGVPKGVVRSHGFIVNLVDVMTESGMRDQFDGPDLSIFPGLTLLHLCSGRGSLIVNHDWKDKDLDKIDDLHASLQPDTLSCGPKFLEKVIAQKRFPGLRHVYFGGATTPLDTLKKAYEHWPQAEITHIYGGSEAEPISLADGRDAIRHAELRGDQEVLFVGKPIDVISSQYIEGEGLWVKGNHVCGQYFSASPEDRSHKKVDECGDVWHLTGDRIEETPEGWYLQGREQKAPAIHEIERRVKGNIGHINVFADSTPGGVIVYGESVKSFKSSILALDPSIVDVVDTTIIRDRRHRARIDRTRTIRRKSYLARIGRFLNERSPLVILSLIAMGPSLGAALTYGDNVIGGFISYLMILLSLVVARVNDELKDYHKDILVNPSRPLPRGLLSVNELGVFRSSLYILFAILTGGAGVIAGWQGVLWSIVLFGFLKGIEKDFYLSEFFEKRLAFSSLVHQLMVIPLYVLPFVLVGAAWNDPIVLGFVAINQFSSLLYEVSRKMDESSHEESKNYLQVYGRNMVHLALVGVGILLVSTAYMFEAGFVAVSIGVVLYAAALAKNYFGKNIPQALEGLASLVSLITLWYLVF